uniref:MFS domain-containing protein n=1 Tax=Macrostomum lignano TaxID=282301 RepID=A0A1I8IY38_9PLAT
RVYQSPNGGWGWVVVASAFCVHLVIDGITYAFGVLTTELTAGGWINSIMVGITLGAGPVASVASTKFGNRPVAMTGAVIGSIGFAVSYFATEAWMLVITIGCLVGLGMSLIYLPTIVTVGIYFTTLRSTAIGIAPIISLLIETYTWRGAMLILSAILLHCAVFGSMFRPLPLLELPLRKPSTVASEEAADVAKKADNGDLKTELPPHANDGKTGDSRRELQKLLDRHDEMELVLNPGGHGRRPGRGMRAIRGGGGGGGKSGGYGDFLSMQDMSQRQRMVPRSGSIDLEEQPKDGGGTAQGIQLTHVTRPVHFIRSITSIATLRDEETGETATAVKADAEGRSLREMIREELAGLMNLSLLRDISFVMFLISNLLGSIGFNAPFLFVPDRAQQAGISKTLSSLLVSVIGISNMVGRVTFGFLSDRKWVNKLMLYNSALTIAGTVLVFSFLTDAYWFMATYCALHLRHSDVTGAGGFARLGEVERLVRTNAAVPGHRGAGFLFDWTLSFDIPFIVCGVCVLVSGLMLYPVPCVLRWQYPGGKERRNTMEMQ